MERESEREEGINNNANSNNSKSNNNNNGKSINPFLIRNLNTRLREVDEDVRGKEFCKKWVGFFF